MRVNEGVALRYESVLEMPHHFHWAHSSREEDVSTHHGVLRGHGVLQLGFYKHKEGGVSEVIMDTLLYLPSSSPSPSPLNPSHSPTREWVGAGSMSGLGPGLCKGGGGAPLVVPTFTLPYSPELGYWLLSTWS